MARMKIRFSRFAKLGRYLLGSALCRGVGNRCFIVGGIELFYRLAYRELDDHFSLNIRGVQ